MRARSDTRRGEIKREILEATNGALFVSKNKLCKILGIGEKNLVEFLEGMEYWKRSNNRRYYFVSDVAGRIYYDMAHSAYSRYSYYTPQKPDMRGMAYTQITRELIKYCNDEGTPEFYRSPFATTTQICKLLGVDMKFFKQFFGDLEFFKAGTKKLYMLKDITNQIRRNRDRAYVD